MKREISLKIESKIENIPLVSSAVKGICEYLELNKKDTYMIELCVFESVTNSIKHAYKEKDGFFVTIDLNINDNLIIKVKDNGISMDKKFLSKDALKEAQESITEDGRGLLIITKYMDKVNYIKKDNTNILIMEKNIKKEDKK